MFSCVSIILCNVSIFLSSSIWPSSFYSKIRKSLPNSFRRLKPAACMQPSKNAFYTTLPVPSYSQYNKSAGRITRRTGRQHNDMAVFIHRRLLHRDLRTRRHRIQILYKRFASAGIQCVDITVCLGIESRKKSGTHRLIPASASRNRRCPYIFPAPSSVSIFRTWRDSSYYDRKRLCFHH